MNRSDRSQHARPAKSGKREVPQTPNDSAGLQANVAPAPRVEPAYRLRARTFWQSGVALGQFGALIFAISTIALVVNARESETPTPASPEVFINTERWDLALPQSATLRVTNLLGDVRARRASGDELSVIGIIQRFRSEQDDAQVKIEPHEGNLDVSTHYPSALAEATEEGLAGRIDITLLVPPGKAIEVETAAGLIELKGVPRNLKAKSRSGRIRISTSTLVNATSESGPLVIVLKQPGPEKTAALSTATGSIKVDFLEDPFPSLLARTGGKIEAVDIPTKALPDPQNASVSVIRFGKSEPVVQVQSKSGDISLRALPANGLR